MFANTLFPVVRRYFSFPRTATCKLPSIANQVRIFNLLSCVALASLAFPLTGGAEEGRLSVTGFPASDTRVTGFGWATVQDERPANAIDAGIKRRETRYQEATLLDASCYR